VFSLSLISILITIIVTGAVVQADSKNE